MLGTFEGLEISGNLLFGFQASDVPFGLIVGERDTIDESKSQPAVLMAGQTIEQVPAFGVFGLAPFALYGRRFFAVGQLADMLELPLPSLPIRQYNGRFLAVTIELEHKLVHFGRPFGAFFDQIGHFP